MTPGEANCLCQFVISMRSQSCSMGIGSVSCLLQIETGMREASIY